MTDPRVRRAAAALGCLVLWACAPAPEPDPPTPMSNRSPAEAAGGPSPASSGPRTVQAGAPGAASRTVDPDELSSSAGPTYVEADVRFMQGMIPHHAQALEMVGLVRDRATTELVRRMALRMEISQRDEIALMSQWLDARGERQPPAYDRNTGPFMPGMLTPEQMASLEAAEGSEFDRLFLELMIQHHEGAIDMVARLFATPGAGQESEIFQFADDVDVDQRMEIDRMRQALERR